ncbi:MAG: 16S rRNA (guanine(966)-N(2))-methyltransferase RsmD [Gammaproteobacteria bacterium]|nr:16S rRNA (guanine(966)-N(2))-methyltransferase RsmD [Gammaproteobacteria bacterium]
MKTGSCRIIGGKWRGRVIRFDDAEGLRPTTDRIRETVFNWLQAYLPGSTCLDAFAGSGVLGLEALSRGAANVVFIEKNKKTASRIKDNIKMLDAQGGTVYQQDVLAWLKSAQPSVQRGKPFDLVFLDPPFHLDLLAKCSAELVSCDCLAKDAVIYVEHGIDEEVALPAEWKVLKQKRAGQVCYQLFELCVE